MSKKEGLALQYLHTSGGFLGVRLHFHFERKVQIWETKLDQKAWDRPRKDNCAKYPNILNLSKKSMTQLLKEVVMIWDNLFWDKSMAPRFLKAPTSDAIVPIKMLLAMSSAIEMEESLTRY